MSRFSSLPIKDVVNLSLPMAGSRFIQMFTGFVGMVMAAHLGKTVLAACALINSTLAAILLIFISIVFAVSFVTGQMAGANDHDRIGALVQQSLLLSFVLGLVMVPLFWFAGDILRLSGQSPEIVVYINQYFHAMMWAAIPILLQTCMQQFLYGLLKQRIVIFINLFSMIMGIPLVYVLIFGKWGIPAQGVAGMAYTFAFQSTFSFLAIVAICFFKADFHQYQLFKKHDHRGTPYFRQVFAVGWPMSVQFGGELLAFFVISVMIGWIGVDALAAVQVTQQWLFLVVVPIFAMSEAAGILVGRAVGAHHQGALKSIGDASLLVTLAFVLLLDVLFIAFPHYFASMYLNVNDPANASTVHLIRILFIILTATLILNAFRDVTSGLLRGLYDTRFPMRIGIFVMWCLVVPIGYFMAFVLHWGVIGFKVGGNIGLLIGAVIIYKRWLTQVQWHSLR